MYMVFAAKFVPCLSIPGKTVLLSCKGGFPKIVPGTTKAQTLQSKAHPQATNTHSFTPQVNDKLQLIDVDIYYKADSFLLLGSGGADMGQGLY